MAPLNAKKRNALPASKFGLPKTREYPIDTPPRAQAALARAAANATPAQQAEIRRRVKAAYPGMRVLTPKGK